MLENEAEHLIRKAIDLAKQGNLLALRLCLYCLLPVCKERFVSLDLGPAESAADLPKTFQSIFAAVAEGRITPAEGESLSNILQSHARTSELIELDRRLQALEACRSEIQAYQREAHTIPTDLSEKSKP